MNIRSMLFELRDEKYADFSAKLMPTLDKSTVIGVRIPVLRRLVKKISGTHEAQAFLRDLPHKYFEENNLHAFIVCETKDFDKCLSELERFLPFVDNWATCDSMRPKSFRVNSEKFLPKINEWIASDHTYTVRFAIELLMTHFLDESFDESYLCKVASVKSNEYYVNMMKAWYFATALAKQYDATAIYLEQNRLDAWTHNKTIQKAVESYRITAEQKAYLRTLRRK